MSEKDAYKSLILLLILLAPVLRHLDALATQSWVPGSGLLRRADGMGLLYIRMQIPCQDYHVQWTIGVFRTRTTRTTTTRTVTIYTIHPYIACFQTHFLSQALLIKQKITPTIKKSLFFSIFAFSYITKASLKWCFCLFFRGIYMPKPC